MFNDWTFFECWPFTWACIWLSLLPDCLSLTTRLEKSLLRERTTSASGTCQSSSFLYWAGIPIIACPVPIPALSCPSPVPPTIRRRQSGADNLAQTIQRGKFGGIQKRDNPAIYLPDCLCWISPWLPDGFFSWCMLNFLPNVVGLSMLDICQIVCLMSAGLSAGHWRSNWKAGTEPGRDQYGTGNDWN